MTEQKIQEAFDKWVKESCEVPTDIYEEFRAGYMALLNDLEPEMAITDSNFSSHLVETLYRLPEGVTK